MQSLGGDALWRVVGVVAPHDRWIVSLGSRDLAAASRRNSPDGLQTTAAGVVSSVARCRLAILHGWSHSEGLVPLAIRHGGHEVLAWAQSMGCRHWTHGGI